MRQHRKLVFERAQWREERRSDDEIRRFSAKAKFKEFEVELDGPPFFIERMERHETKTGRRGIENRFRVC